MQRRLLLAGCVHKWSLHHPKPQRASNTERISMQWRHDAISFSTSLWPEVKGPEVRSHYKKEQLLMDACLLNDETPLTLKHFNFVDFLENLPEWLCHFWV